MRRRAILHIGTEKTGTTAIQNRMRASALQLAQQGVLYPEVLGPGNHTHLVAACMDDDVWDGVKAHILATHAVDPRQFRRRFQAELAQTLGRSGNWNTIVASSELIHSRLTRPSETARLLDVFRPFVDDFLVVLFIRRQDRLAVSRFSTALRGGCSDFEQVFGNVSPSNYFRYPPERPIDDFADYFDYRRLIERFLPHVPIERIKVALYPEGGSADDDSVSGFARVTGLDPALVDGVRDRVNLPMPVEAQFIMSEVNKLAPMYFASGRRNRHLKMLHAEIEKTVSGSRRYVRRADAEAFAARFEASNEWVRATFFPDRHSLFSERFNQYPEEVEYSGLRDQLNGELGRFRRLALSVPRSEPPLPTFLAKVKRRIWPRKLASR